MIYGKSDTLDMDRIIDMLQAFEKFVAVKDNGDGRSVSVTPCPSILVLPIFYCQISGTQW